MAGPPGTKVFWFFFSKKTCFLPGMAASLNPSLTGHGAVITFRAANQSKEA
jgi:hypothetical protein